MSWDLADSIVRLAREAHDRDVLRNRDGIVLRLSSNDLRESYYHIQLDNHDPFLAHVTYPYVPHLHNDASAYRIRVDRRGVSTLHVLASTMVTIYLGSQYPSGPTTQQDVRVIVYPASCEGEKGFPSHLMYDHTLHTKEDLIKAVREAFCLALHSVASG